MITKQKIGMVGSITLIAGVFSPTVSVPILGQVNCFNYGRGGAILLVLGIVSFILVFAKAFEGLWITGISSFLVIISIFMEFKENLAKLKSELGILGELTYLIQPQWGWALLIVGAALLLACASMEKECNPIVEGEPMSKIGTDLNVSQSPENPIENENAPSGSAINHKSDCSNVHDELDDLNSNARFHLEKYKRNSAENKNVFVICFLIFLSFVTIFVANSGLYSIKSVVILSLAVCVFILIYFLPKKMS